MIVLGNSSMVKREIYLAIFLLQSTKPGAIALGRLQEAGFGSRAVEIPNTQDIDDVLK